MMLLVQCAWEAAVAVGSRALGGEEDNGEATVAGAHLNQGSRLAPATFLASSPQARDPSALWLLPAHSCADTSARVLLREAKRYFRSHTYQPTIAPRTPEKIHVSCNDKIF